MEHHVKFRKTMEIITGQNAEELFNNIISEIPLKEDIILIHEAIQSFTDYDCQMVFLNEPGNIRILTDKLQTYNLTVKCEDEFEHDDVENNDMLMLIKEDTVILCDFTHYIGIVQNLKLSEKEYEDILTFCIGWEVIYENNSYYLKPEFSDKRTKLYTTGIAQ